MTRFNALPQKRILIAVAAVATALFLSTLVPHAATIRSGSRVVDASYPATVCPSGVSGAQSVAYLPNAKIAVRSVKSGSTRLRPSRTFRYSLAAPLFVDGSAQSIMTANTLNGWLATTICSAGNVDSWFVGGSAGISSSGYIDLVNSGLSESTVDLFPFSAKGAAAMVSVVIPANSEKTVLLDSLAPGEENIAVHAVTRAGRVTAFYLDVRKKGLRSLGADYVSPAMSTSKHIVLPGAINSVSKGAQLDQTVRLLAPGAIDASVSATIYSIDGAFSPVGLDNLRLPHGKVVDITLPQLTVSTPFAIAIDGDQPLVAGLLSKTRNGASDFAWSGAAQELPKDEPVSINMGGHSPLISFYSDGRVDVRISYNLPSGKSGSAEVVGDRRASWRSPGAVNRIEVTSLKSKSYGAILFSGAANSGLSYLPLQTGATLQNSVVPVADAGVISRGAQSSTAGK